MNCAPAAAAVQALLIMAVQGTTFQELISKHPSVSREQINEQCSADLAYEIAQRMDEWKVLALFLKLEDAEISEVEKDNTKEIERKLGTLNKWRRKFGPNATHRRLVEAFLKCQRVDLAETVFNLLEQRSTSVSKSRIGYFLTKLIPQNFSYCLPSIQCNIKFNMLSASL